MSRYRVEGADMQVSVERLATDRDATAISAVAKGLAHPVRVAIVRQLASVGPSVASDIAHASGLAQSTVSEHLRVLRDAGVLSSHKEGRRVWYCLDAQTLTEFAGAVADVSDAIACSWDEVP